MTDTDAQEQRPSADGRPAGQRPSRRRMGAWTKALLAASVVLMAVGAALQGYGWLRGSSPTPARTQAAKRRLALPVKGLLPTASPDDESPEQAGADPAEKAIEDWYPAVFRLGFGFFAGFCVAYALRTFLKISLVAVGLVLLALFGLQYAGLIQVDWSATQGHYDRAAEWLGSQASTLRAFVTGYLPSSASGALGLVVGFRKR